MRLAVISMGFVALFPSAASASSCDNFNLLRFDPAALEQCIRDMQLSEMVERNAMNSQIKLLQIQVCNLAMTVAEFKPMPDDVLKSYCFAMAQPKKLPSKPKSQSK
jgi:hypothetical protein